MLILCPLFINRMLRAGEYLHSGNHMRNNAKKKHCQNTGQMRQNFYLSSYHKLKSFLSEVYRSFLEQYFTTMKMFDLLNWRCLQYICVIGNQRIWISKKKTSIPNSALQCTVDVVVPVRCCCIQQNQKAQQWHLPQAL